MSNNEVVTELIKEYSGSINYNCNETAIILAPKFCS